MPEPQDDKHAPDIPIELHNWLRVATRDLCSPARRRVRAEVEAHFTDALTEGGTLYSPETVARAIQSLGNPHKAARAFRRTYLTRRERVQIRAWVQYNPFSLKNGLIVILAFCWDVFSQWGRIKSPTPLKLVLYISLWLVIYTLLIWTATLPARLRRSLSAREILSRLIFLVPLSIGMLYLPRVLFAGDDWLMLPIVTGGFFVIALLMFVPFIRKLGHCQKGSSYSYRGPGDYA